MFTVSGNPILVPEIEVLQELKTQLAQNGILLFNEFKVGQNNIQFNCPAHGGGQERRPSCGITTNDTTGVPAGTVHCFTCGYTASLEEMISDAFGRKDFGAYGLQWLVKNFLTVAVEDRPTLSLDLNRSGRLSPVLSKGTGEHRRNSDENVAEPMETTLERFRYTHPYAYKRKLTDDVIEKFDVGYDNHFVLRDPSKNSKQVLRCLTFPVRNEFGEVLFIARRSVDIKLFHYPVGVNKPVYGLYELPKDADEIIICESIINALTCYVYGKPAVALLGLGTPYQFEQLKRLPCRKFIIALDGDEAGDRATLRIRKALSGVKLLTRYIVPRGKDINDLSEEEFHNLQEIF